MGYYIRVLSTSADLVPLPVLQSALEAKKLQAVLTIETGDDANWEQLLLSHESGQEIASIERNLVEPGSLGAEELTEFVEEVSNCQPASAANWLRDYFRGVRCIYAFQVLSGTEHKNGWEILGAVKNRIWFFAPSILQADREGFSNEDGYHILWQFGDSASGDWWMGVLQEGQWRHFQMDLGNRSHREAFRRGEVPPGTKLA